MLKIYCFTGHNQPVKELFSFCVFLSHTITVNNNNKMTIMYQTHVHSRNYAKCFIITTSRYSRC